MPSGVTVRDEQVIKSQKGLYFMGKDIREVPCLRSSILLGITCGTFAGLISFMTTSKVAMSSHIGFASLWVVVFAYWIPCRYKYETNKKMMKLQYEEAVSGNLAFLNASLIRQNEEKKQ